MLPSEPSVSIQKDKINSTDEEKVSKTRSCGGVHVQYL